MTKDKQIILKLRDEFVDIMCEVNESHKANVVIENRKETISTGRSSHIRVHRIRATMVRLIR